MKKLFISTLLTVVICCTKESPKLSANLKDNHTFNLKADAGRNHAAEKPAIRTQEETNPESPSPKNKQNWKGDYQIRAKAISDYNQKEIVLLYSIAVTSDHSAILSIGADQVQDYWCEGDYYLTDKKGIIYARGKCDEDDLNDFMMKYEGDKYYIKSKRFLNQDWQILEKV